MSACLLHFSIAATHHVEPSYVTAASQALFELTRLLQMLAFFFAGTRAMGNESMSQYD